MGRWILRIGGGLVVAVALVALLAWLTLRASLPTLDGEISVVGLDAMATIERDADGIPTITASSRADLAYATGFAHGQDRFFQMDLLRRRSAGELAEMFGEIAAEADKRYRWHRFRSRAVEGFGKMSQRDKQLLERYAGGVNAGLASLSAKPFEYFLLGADPRPWAPEDSFLVLYTMFLQLNDERGMRDVRRGLVHRVVPQEMYAFMYPQGTEWDAPLMGDARASLPVPSADVISLHEVDDDAPPAREVGKPQLNGSNNWVVSGALTQSGRAIVSNDMHLGLTAPNIYYQARIVVDGAESREATGVTLPGAPFVIAGSNTKIAWGFTNSYRIEVKDGDAVEVTIRETIWGPVNDSISYPDGDVAVSWTAHHEEAVNLRLVDVETADSVFAAVDIANTAGIPPQNFVTGDAEGNIAWTLAGKIPLRSDYDPLLPADWSAVPGWTGWAEVKDYPRIINPESGRIWTANARVADGDALKLIGDSGYDLGARSRQIRDALFAQDLFAPADMLEIQIDDRALFLRRWRGLLLEVLDEETIANDESLREYRRLVDNWIPRAAPESVGYRLVRAFRLEVQARVFHALMASVRTAYDDDVRLRISNQFEAPLWSLVSEQPEHLLPADYENWQELLVAAVRENIDYFANNYDGSLADRSWGERNVTRISHPLSRAVPMLSGLLDMPYEPIGGDVDLPKAQGPTFGASERFSVSPGDEANSLMHMPTGQSGHPLSAYYRQGHDDWVRGRQSPFLPGNTQHKLTLLPATE
jgi:penicillin amidase